MSTDKKTQGGAPAPRRAEPLQPDKPGRGVGREPDSTASDSQGVAKKTSDDQSEQSKTAVENNREGYR